MADLLRVFEAALAEETGQVIVAISELSEGDLERVIEAAQLVDKEGQDHGDAWHGWAKVDERG